MLGILSTSILTISVVTLLAVYPSSGTGFRILNTPVRSPVILVPGDGGSQLQAKLDKPKKSHIYCDKKTDGYFNLWLNPNLLVPGVVKCWVDNMRLVYNRTSRTTLNSPGVDIRVPGFGDTATVEWLDPSGVLLPFFRRAIMSSYYVDIVNGLVEIGYKRGHNVRGAPYDYRKAPNEMKEYFRSVEKLVEETYELNNGTKITFVCHSMGCPISSYFFNQQRQSWKDKHIKGLVSLGGAFGGAVKAMKTIASGENLGILIVKQSILKTEQKTGPSLPYMLPSRLLWHENETLAMTKSKNYTVSNYEEFFRDINDTTAYEMYKDTHLLAEEGLHPPGIEVLCLHGTGLPTVEMLDYRKDKSLPNYPVLMKGEGDGTVNLRSLEACTRWKGNQKQTVYHKTFPKLEHLSILCDRKVIEYIKQYVVTW